MQSAFWSISPSRRCPRDQRPDYRDPRPRSDRGPAASSGRHDLDNGYASDPNGVPRLVSAMPTREDYLTLAFDEICQYGIGSVRVMRRLRAALTALSESLTDADRAGAVRSYLKHLDLAIAQSPLDAQDQAVARETDRQGLGLTRRTNG